MKILAIDGSLREGSSNSALLAAAAGAAPAGVSFDLYTREIGALPHFNPDLDGEGATPPAAVKELRERLRAADGVVISSPEYAHGAPGVLKNALDWIVSSGELENKPVLFIAASPSGGRWAQASLTPTLEVLGAKIVANLALVFTRADVDADAEGRVKNGEILAMLKDGVQALASAIRGQTP